MKFDMTLDEMREWAKPQIEVAPKPLANSAGFIQFITEWIGTEGAVMVVAKVRGYMNGLVSTLPPEAQRVLEAAEASALRKNTAPVPETEPSMPPGYNENESAVS